jgi:ribosomal protein S18 acetylase RimI-like enzyme
VSGTDGVHVRRATAADAQAVARVQVRGWLHAYEDIVPPERLAHWTVERREPVWRAMLDEGAGAWVAEAAGRVAGFVAVGAARDPDAQAGTGELYALYVDPVAQGAGLGRRLLDAGVAELRALGFAAATLWVFERNGNARGFYERHGWTLDPSGAPDPDWSAPAVRYRRALMP